MKTCLWTIKFLYKFKGKNFYFVKYISIEKHKIIESYYYLGSAVGLVADSDTMITIVLESATSILGSITDTAKKSVGLDGRLNICKRLS